MLLTAKILLTLATLGFSFVPAGAACLLKA